MVTFWWGLNSSTDSSSNLSTSSPAIQLVFSETLLDSFHGNPNSIATLFSKNCNSSLRVGTTLSLTPLKGLLVLTDHGCFRSSLREYRSSLAISCAMEYGIHNSFVYQFYGFFDWWPLFIRARNSPGIIVDGSVIPINSSHSLADKILIHCK